MRLTGRDEAETAIKRLYRLVNGNLATDDDVKTFEVLHHFKISSAAELAICLSIIADAILVAPFLHSVEIDGEPIPRRMVFYQGLVFMFSLHKSPEDEQEDYAQCCVELVSARPSISAKHLATCPDTLRFDTEGKLLKSE